VDYAELIGLDYILKALEKLEPSTSVMFEGQRGCGKTTLAFKKAKDFGAPPENIEQVNCADNTGIDFHRDLIGDIHRSSLFGEKKVLILDEIHGLSIASQNAWLIPLENTNENTLVMACTTTVDKVIPTLLRRFVRFKVHPLSVANSKLLVENLCRQKNTELSKIAKALLIEKTEGIPGLIISNFPKLINVENETEIRYLLELSSMDVAEDILHFFKIFKATADWIVIKQALKQLMKEKSPNEIRMGLLNLTAHWFTSDFYKESIVDKKLVRLYNNLYQFYTEPQKANLIVAIFSSLGG